MIAPSQIAQAGLMKGEVAVALHDGAWRLLCVAHGLRVAVLRSMNTLIKSLLTLASIICTNAMLQGIVFSAVKIALSACMLEYDALWPTSQELVSLLLWWSGRHIFFCICGVIFCIFIGVVPEIGHLLPAHSQGRCQAHAPGHQ